MVEVYSFGLEREVAHEMAAAKKEKQKSPR
jgi:hypothetical protein